MIIRAFIILFCFVSIIVDAQQPNYNIVWTTQSKNASESMPCGGGDIGLNVWVENGELLIYAARSGSFNEDNALMKAGRIRIKLFPNPFDARLNDTVGQGKIFKQELHLQKGYVTVDGENNGVKATLRIWVDVFNPVAHFEINSNKKIAVEAIYESWRYQDRVLQPRENYANSWKWAPPKNNRYKKNEINKLQKLQNKIVKIMFANRFCRSASEIYTKT